MVRDLADVAGAVFGVFCIARWYLAQPEHEPRAALWGGIGSLVVVAIHKAYDLGYRAMSEQERTDLYQKRKAAFEEARRQIKNERNYLEKMARDASLVAGKEHLETTPLTQIISRVAQLGVYRGYKHLSAKVTTECQNILKLPSGKRDATRLIPPLRKLYGKIAAELHEPDDWERTWEGPKDIDEEKVDIILGLMGRIERLASHCAKHDKYAGEDSLRIWGHRTRGLLPVAIISGKTGTKNHRVLMEDGTNTLVDINQLKLFTGPKFIEVFREAFARASEPN